jgi:hypothetical protein
MTSTVMNEDVHVFNPAAGDRLSHGLTNNPHGG